MYKTLEKDTIQNNIKNIVETEVFHDLYNRMLYTDELKDMEKTSAQIFNTVLFTCQLVEDLDAIQKMIPELLEKASNYDGVLSSGDYASRMYLEILKKYDAFYLENGHDKMIHRLKHGVAVHFTTPRIMEKIENDGFLYAYGSMFPKEVEEKILAAGKYQREHSEDAEKAGVYLSQGFGFSKGISMSSQTNGFWMNHTPESLTFLFSGKVFTRNKKGAMKYIDEAISTLPDAQKVEIKEIMEHIWDDLIGTDESLGCILVDRDSLEYETVTYWNETPPRVEELRPYRDNTLNSLSAMEEERYNKDIPVSALRFVKVPSIIQLEKYRKEHPIADKDKIGYTMDYEEDLEFYDFSDEVYENVSKPQSDYDER